MELGSLSDILTAVSTAGLAGAAIFAALQGSRALGAWRNEAVGKRKIDVAQQVLADFYEARDIINGARLPVTFEGEGNTRPKGEGESDGRKRRLNSYYVVLERLNRYEEFFARLFARRYRFIALFGLNTGKTFDELFGIRNELLMTVNLLVRGSPEQWSREDLRGMEAKIGWCDPTGDPIRGKLDRVVQTMEQVCRPIIQANA